MTTRERNCNDAAGLPVPLTPSAVSSAVPGASAVPAHSTSSARGAAPSIVFAARVADALAGAGWCVVDEALPGALVAALATRARALDASGTMTPAAIGRHESRQQGGDVRGDRTSWLDAAHEDASESAFLAHLDAMRAALNEALFLGLTDVEAHFAVYPPGARYAAHRDRFRDDDKRVLSAVYYLNDTWRETDGGALRLHVAPTLDVLPNGGRAVYFRSDAVLHEVLPATRERLSVAAWFRRR